MNEILIGLFCIILFYVFIFIGYKVIQNKRNIKPAQPSVEDQSSKMIDMTETNNNYEPLLDVLINLDRDLSELGVTLHADMRGYLDYAERK